MGIKGLTKLLNDSSTDKLKCMKETELSSYNGQIIAVDASMAMYQFLVAVRSGGPNQAAMMLTNDAGEVTSHIQGMFNRTIRLLSAGVRPVYVFDGKPPTLKGGELAKRGAKRTKAEEDLKAAEEAGAVDDIDKFSKRLVKVSRKHNDDCKRLLRLMGVPVVDAPCEAEAQCAAMAEQGKVWGTATEDMDALTFRTPHVVRRMTFSSNQKQPILQVDYDKVLEVLELTYHQFVDLCILCGCDYTDTIKGIGAKTALKLVKQHGKLEAVIEALLADKKRKWAIPPDWLPPTKRRANAEASKAAAEAGKGKGKGDGKGGKFKASQKGKGSKKKNEDDVEDEEEEEDEVESADGSSDEDDGEDGEDSNQEDNDGAALVDSDDEDVGKAKGKQAAKQLEADPASSPVAKKENDEEGTASEEKEKEDGKEVKDEGKDKGAEEEGAPSPTSVNDVKAIDKTDNRNDTENSKDTDTGKGTEKAAKAEGGNKAEEAEAEAGETDDNFVPMYVKVRELFYSPEVDDPATIQLRWADPDEDGLRAFLVEEMGFGGDRVETGIKKLKDARGKSSQKRMDSFFKVLAPAPSEAEKGKGNGKGQKRKAGGGAQAAKKGRGGGGFRRR